MQKIIFIVISSLFISAIYSQEQKDSIHYPTGDFGSMDLVYGTFFCKQNFNNQVNTFKQFKVARPIRTIGLSLTVAYFALGKHDYGMHLSYVQVIPQKMQVNDTMNGNINGFTFSCNISGIDITPESTYSSIIFGAGFNTGRLRITSNSYRAQKNPFFAPALYFNSRFFLGHITIGLRAEYQFDISKKGWRSVNISNKTTPFTLMGLRQSGLVTSFSVGWKF